MPADQREPQTYTARIHSEPEGSWWAEVAGLPGCFASGHERGEIAPHVTEAISVYLSAPGLPVRLVLKAQT